MKDAENIVVDGRNLQIRYSNDKSSQMKGGNNSAKKGPASEFGVFVGNISYKCTENDLKKFFKDCGKVVDVRIAKKPDGKLKGFVDHDHTGNFVRGILCTKCNTLLGMANDNIEILENAIKYLMKSKR